MNVALASLERSTPASQPAVVHAPLEVSICMIMGMHVNICRCNTSICTFVRHRATRAQLVHACSVVDLSQDLQQTTPNQVLDDFAVAQSTPLLIWRK